MQIDNWYDLINLESDYYKLFITPEWNCGYIIPKRETEETIADYWKHHRYLSPYTFTDDNKKCNELLRSYGFNDIILKRNEV